MRYTEAIVTTGTNLQHRLRETVGTSVPGIAVAVVDADGVRDAVAVGMADLGSSRPASPDMVCPWFSMTKIVTATAAMRLTERGVLDLDAPLAPHVAADAPPPSVDGCGDDHGSPPPVTQRRPGEPDPRRMDPPAGSGRSRPRHVPRRPALQAREAPLRAGHQVELLEPRNARPGSGDGEPHANAVHGTGAARRAGAARHAIHGIRVLARDGSARGHRLSPEAKPDAIHASPVGHRPAGRVGGSRSTASCWMVRRTAG